MQTTLAVALLIGATVASGGFKCSAEERKKLKVVSIKIKSPSSKVHEVVRFNIFIRTLRCVDLEPQIPDLGISEENSFTSLYITVY